jgi:hypothetical protein
MAATAVRAARARAAATVLAGFGIAWSSASGASGSDGQPGSGGGAAAAGGGGGVLNWKAQLCEFADGLGGGGGGGGAGGCGGRGGRQGVSGAPSVALLIVEDRGVPAAGQPAGHGARRPRRKRVAQAATVARAAPGSRRLAADDGPHHAHAGRTISGRARRNGRLRRCGWRWRRRLWRCLGGRVVHAHAGANPATVTMNNAFRARAAATQDRAGWRAIRQSRSARGGGQCARAELSAARLLALLAALCVLAALGACASSHRCGGRELCNGKDDNLRRPHRRGLRRRAWALHRAARLRPLRARLRRGVSQRDRHAL